MGIVNRYRMKPGVTLDDIKHELQEKHLPISTNTSYIDGWLEFSTFSMLVDEISVNIGFPKDVSKWDDYEHIVVIDEDFLQPYGPFYNIDEDPFIYALNVVGHYNKFMDSLSFLEEVSSNG